MPLYDYQCTACEKVSEVRHGFREAYQGACPACGANSLKRVFNAAPVLFKGSGFYVNDSRPKTKSTDGAGSADSTSTTAPASSPSPPPAAGSATSPASSPTGGGKKGESSAA